MALTDLMPWNRHRAIAPARFTDEADPFLALHRGMTRMLDDFSSSFGVPAVGTAMTAGWPRIEVKDGEKEVSVVAELPGLEQKDVELSLHDGLLTLKGEKKSESGNALYSERWHGQFQRSIQLGPEIDPENVSAAFKNGVLTVTLGKRAESQSAVKRIAITAN
jgi:HSP20 family protein